MERRYTNYIQDLIWAYMFFTTTANHLSRFGKMKSDTEVKKNIVKNGLFKIVKFKIMENKQCVAGCKHFEGGEIKHHKDCDFYADSLTKYYDDLLLNITRVEVINHNSSNFEIGRIFAYRGDVEVSLQDDNKTLKIFI